MANRQTIDELFRDRLSNHEVSPPLRNWKIIQSGLPGPKPFYQNPLFLVGVATAALIMGSIIGYWSSEQAYNRTQTFQQQAPTPYRYDNNHQNGQGTSTTISTSPAVQQQFVPVPDNSFAKSAIPVPPANNIGQKQAAKRFAPKEPLESTDRQKQMTLLLPPSSLPTTDTKTEAVMEKSTLPAAYTPLSDIGIGKNTSNQSQMLAFEKDNTGITYTNGGKQQLPPDNPLLRAAHITDQQSSVAADAAAFVPQPLTKDSRAEKTSNDAHAFYYMEKVPSAGETLLSVQAQAGKQSIETPIVAQNALLTAPAPIKLPRNNTSGFSIGMLGMANHTWVLGKSVSDPATVGELTSQFDMGNSFGAVMSYDWSKKWGVSVDVLHTQQGQTYTRNISGEIKNTQLHMTYWQIPLTVHYKHPHYSRFFNRLSSCNVGMGLQYSLLQSAEIPLDNPALQNGLLKKHNWGVVLDADYDLSLSKHIYLNVGVRGTLSTGSNGFALPWFNSTNNALLGVKSGIYYKF